jgi:adenine phosphoribosyltransferase
VVQFGDYSYFVHPITDGIPPCSPSLLEEVLDGLEEIGDFRGDIILTAESMGFPLAAALSMRTGLPYLFIRKRQYGLPGEVSVRQITGYAGSDLYLNELPEGSRATFVDDVVSTGGTLRAVTKAVRSAGSSVDEILVVFDKTKDLPSLAAELGTPIRALLRVDVKEGRARVLQ